MCAHSNTNVDKTLVNMTRRLFKERQAKKTTSLEYAHHNNYFIVILVHPTQRKGNKCAIYSIPIIESFLSAIIYTS